MPQARPRKRKQPGAPAALLGVLVISGLFSLAAGAQVIEVGPEGVTVLKGPAMTTPNGAFPINPPKSPTATIGSGADRRRQSAAPLLADAASRSDLSDRLVEAVAYVESRFDTGAISPKGAIGMMQLMPGTASDLEVNPRDPVDNVRGGAAYLRKMLAMFDGDVEKALAAYNAGPAAVMRYGGVPPYPETRAYVAAVMDYLAEASLSEVK